MTAYSGLWDNQYGIPYANLGSQLSLTINTAEWNMNQRMLIAKMLRKRGNRPMAALMYSLLGAAAGSGASDSIYRLTAESGLGLPLAQGGVRTIAAWTNISRNTTTADRDVLRDLTSRIFGPTLVSGYPTDRSTNGGGGKVGAF